MSKFKIGDKVTLRKDVDEYGDTWTHGKEYIVTGAYTYNGYDRIETNIDNHGSKTNGWLASKLELIQSSPIRTTTRKEIVAGEYGIVEIYNSNCGEIRYSILPYATSEQLREAANTLIQIAEALEFNEQ